MASSKELFDQTRGQVYLIPIGHGGSILAQVGYGGDLGVFDGPVDAQEDIQNLDRRQLFRVHYGHVSPKKFQWLDKGMFPFKGSLFRPHPYLHRPVGDAECYLIKYGGRDELVSCAKAAEYEPLATWSHEHIVDRFLRQTEFRGRDT